MPTPKRDPLELTEAAWAGINELTYSGKITLPDGTIIQPDPRIIVDVMKWLAGLQGKPRKTPKAPEDWAPPETKA